MSVFNNPADAAADAADAYIEAVLGMLGDRDPRSVLVSAPAEFANLIDGHDDGRLRCPEGPGRWSVGQVLAHMADSEFVWAYRLRMALGGDRPALQGYDQDAWATRLRYEDADPVAALHHFEQARKANLALLDRLDGPALDRVAVHVERGEESVRHMIRLYAGHDLVHLAQARRILSIEPKTEE
jgi:uncharacterized damage-inducible protein DinB